MDIFAIAGVGTNFMFSLGIIFVIIFVVFYIRQRLSNFDHKLNSMFQLINAMAEEVDGLKKSSLQVSSGNNMNKCIPDPSGACLRDPMSMSQLMNPMNSQLLSVSDDETDSDDESDSDSDSDDESEYESHDEKTIEILDNKLEHEGQLVFDEVTKTNIPIEIIGEDTPMPDASDVEEVYDDENDEVKTIQNLQTIDFKKMSVKELRHYIEENQITEQDISKMKKQELINLCV
jgi:ABC-type multidrug transport system fused ATPase/permease subunit